MITTDGEISNSWLSVKALEGREGSLHVPRETGRQVDDLEEEHHREGDEGDRGEQLCAVRGHH